MENKDDIPEIEYVRERDSFSARYGFGIDPALIKKASDNPKFRAWDEMKMEDILAEMSGEDICKIARSGRGLGWLERMTSPVHPDLCFKVEEESNLINNINMKQFFKIEDVLTGIYDDEPLRTRVIPMFVSHPGTNKTTAIRNFAKSRGVNLVDIIASTVSPNEVTGMSVPNHATEKMMVYDFDRMLNMKDGDILFFDELLNGSPAIPNACMTIFQERIFISGKKLPKIMIVCATNIAGKCQTTPQMRDRYVVYDIELDEEGYIQHLINRHGITRGIGQQLVKLVKSETYVGDNMNSSRSIDLAIEMIVKNVPTPYYERLFPILGTLVKNTTDKQLEENGVILEPGEAIRWIDLIRKIKK